MSCSPLTLKQDLVEVPDSWNPVAGTKCFRDYSFQKGLGFTMVHVGIIFWVRWRDIARRSSSTSLALAVQVKRWIRNHVCKLANPTKSKP